MNDVDRVNQIRFSFQIKLPKKQLAAAQPHTIMKIGLFRMVMMCVSLANTANAFVGQVSRRHDPSKSSSFVATITSLSSQRTGTNNNNNDDGDGETDEDSLPLPEYELPEEKAERLRRQAEEMRKQIERLENTLIDSRQRLPPRERFVPPTPFRPKATDDDDDDDDEGLGAPTLRNKRIMVAGANGRLGSMICRYLLRNHPEIKEVVAMVHTVGEASTRGYGRLSYEVVRKFPQSYRRQIDYCIT
jgi:hypothetical protein